MITTKPSARYLLDANTFIEAHRRYYALDFCPPYWRALLALHAQGKVASIHKVRDEMLRGKDDLAKWIKHTTPAGFFEETTDDDSVAAFRQLNNWVNHRGYTEKAKQVFFHGVDGWLVAHAKSFGYTVVTHETPDPAAKGRVKIPDMCDSMGIPWVNTFEMLRALRIQFTDYAHDLPDATTGDADADPESFDGDELF